MTETAPQDDLAQTQALQELVDSAHEPSLAEVAARRMAARTQWQKALARAKERFTPGNVKDEMVENAAETIGNAADKAATAAWAHRGKLALAGLLGGLFFARKPLAKASAPLATKARTKVAEAGKALRNRKQL